MRKPDEIGRIKAYFCSNFRPGEHCKTLLTNGASGVSGGAAVFTLIYRTNILHQQLRSSGAHGRDDLRFGFESIFPTTVPLYQTHAHEMAGPSRVRARLKF